MNVPFLQHLRFQGHDPRTMLDVGAHVGAFTKDFLTVFPECSPTLIEPNPQCQDALVKLPYERHAWVASATAGRAEMFLANEWHQSAPGSLDRENTLSLRDKVLRKVDVDKVRLDDAFKGRSFDFVNIDTGGAELDVLKGGREVLSSADHILVTVSLLDDLGAAKVEEIFEQLGIMGFCCSDAGKLHRTREVENGALLQMTFLFQRQVVRPTQNFRYAPLHGHGALLAWLKSQKARCANFTVIDVGAAANPWSAQVLDATFDMNDCPVAPLQFKGNLNDARNWDPVLRHVSQHGRFSYAICSHTLEDLAYPAITLEMLPRIADAGFISVPSRYLESLRPEGPYRGFIHHRWILDHLDGQLFLAPKIGLLEYLALAGEPGWPSAPDRFELQMIWKGKINFAGLNGDYLGPTRKDVIGYYARFLDRP